MNMPDWQLQPTRATIHGIVPGLLSRSLGKVTLEVVFGTEQNFRKEFLSFEVVDVKSSYHALFGRDAYVKFTVRPCYVYLQLKIPGLNGVITIYGDRQKALEYEEDSTLAEAACIAGSSHSFKPPANLQSPK